MKPTSVVPESGKKASIGVEVGGAGGSSDAAPAVGTVAAVNRSGGMEIGDAGGACGVEVGDAGGASDAALGHPARGVSTVVAVNVSGGVEIGDAGGGGGVEVGDGGGSSDAAVGHRARGVATVAAVNLSGGASSMEQGVPVEVPKFATGVFKRKISKRKKRNKKSRKKRGLPPIKIGKRGPAFDESDSGDATEEELSDEVADFQEDIDEKSRHVLRRLMAGKVPYLSGPGRYICPFCRNAMADDLPGMKAHAEGIGSGSGKRKPHIRAKHAAYGMFLQKLQEKEKGNVATADVQPEKKKN